VYKYHHDGPVNNSGGLSLAKNDVLPHARAYLDSELLKDFKSSGPAALGTGARVDSEFKHGRNARPAMSMPGIDTSLPNNSSPMPKVGLDLGEFDAAFKNQLKGMLPPGAEARLRDAQERLADRSGLQPHVTDINSSGKRTEASAISLSLALREHLIEKGFDAETVAKAQTLADTLRGMDNREAASSFLVIHKEGSDVASLVPKADHVIGLRPGDSVLVADRLKALSNSGLDVDAVATLRGLAPEKTQPHSDLEVYQAAPADLYQKAVSANVPLQSSKDAQDLVQGLSTQEKLQTPQQEQRATTAAKESPASPEMSMGV
jgi:hypothetical protein